MSAKLKKNRSVRRSAFTKMANEVCQLLDDGADWEGAFDVLEEMTYPELVKADGAVYAALYDEDAAEDILSEEADSCDAYKLRYANLKRRVTHVAEEKLTSAVSVVSAAPSSSQPANYHWPKLEITKFSGELKEWLPFWHQFERIDKDDSMDKAMKIQYLIQATVPGSKARRTVEKFPATSDNYDEAARTMKDRYGRRDLQIEVRMRELLDLVVGARSGKHRDVVSLYDALDAEIKALSTLGVTVEKYAPMLYPLVESSMPEPLIRLWQRSAEFGDDSDTIVANSAGDDVLQNRLKNLMKFLRREVQSEQRIVGLHDALGVKAKIKRPEGTSASEATPWKGPAEATAVSLLASRVECVFCRGDHETLKCTTAKSWSWEKKQQKLSQTGSCFRCLRRGHLTRACRASVRCGQCRGSHATIMCSPPGQSATSLSKQTAGRDAFLQTVRVMAGTDVKRKIVRVMLDSGANRSYILTATAKELGLVATGTTMFSHEVFGGGVTQEEVHQSFRVTLGHTDGAYQLEIEVLNQDTISNHLSNIYEGQWMDELREKGIELSDTENGPVELLIGADYLGEIDTGEFVKLTSGPYGIKTTLGWTLMGAPPASLRVNTALQIHQSFLTNANISKLWELDCLGIEEPSQRLTKLELAAAAKELFQQTVRTDEDGRYEVCLPWIVNHPNLPTNRSLAEKRLDTTLRRLDKMGMRDSYNKILEEWEAEEIIERVDTSDHRAHTVHYLPHRAVIKEESATTKVRPVFDASAKMQNLPTLNDCLEKGENLIEMIPSLILRFRLYRVGLVSDIRKAFLQVSLRPADRDVVRFLWVDAAGQHIVFRHRRVVFGVNCSPFLLGATIEHHLTNCREVNEFSVDIVSRLARSFYVDNCIVSVADVRAAREFQTEATAIMSKGQFDLRGWECSGVASVSGESVPLLGMWWNTQDDLLRYGDKCFEPDVSKKLTKRSILSIVQSVFDPMGYLCPVLVLPKLILQEQWQTNIGWDTEISGNVRERFLEWCHQLNVLKSLEIPRWVGGEDKASYSLHVFCDASQTAYASAVYLRVEKCAKVKVSLLMAKTRVAPIKALSIPRLELMAATIGSRLFANVRDSLNVEVDSYFWSDSMTALSWIRRSEEWAPFVGNRVREIRALTDVHSWRHVPGIQNPADRPSRGCSAEQLRQATEWWEGPAWLASDNSAWPSAAIQGNEDEILAERKKRILQAMNDITVKDDLRLQYFSKFTKTLRLVAWIRRFVKNCRATKLQVDKQVGPLTAIELSHAETVIWRQVQQQAFSGLEDKRLQHFVVFIDEAGLIRLKSRICNRDDQYNFRFPILLPGDHPVVLRMLHQKHVGLCHCGTTALLSGTRQDYWIVGGRRTIRAVTKKCTFCRRHAARAFEPPTAPLPESRVRDARPFEIVGVDFAGPLSLKGGEKSWVCLFTCAIYRAVHLELSSSLSAASFIQVLRRFVARRGRPSKIFSDNGTNFRGVSNCLKNLDWERVAEYAAVEKIEWQFNPPAASWWGGFWERLIGLLKQLLRRTLGRAALTYEELTTVLCDCKGVLNNRPITYLSDDPTEVDALTPNMFLREAPSDGVPDCDLADGAFMGKRARYHQRLRENLRDRFRKEYLGQLHLRSAKVGQQQLKEGVIVLVGDDAKKRVEWAVGRVAEVIVSADGEVRAAKVKTGKGMYLRPAQKLYPLECVSDRDTMDLKVDQALRTRCGRRVRQPERYGV